MLRKHQGENLRSDSTLHVRAPLHDLVTNGIPHSGSQHMGLFLFVAFKVIWRNVRCLGKKMY